MKGIKNAAGRRTRNAAGLLGLMLCCIALCALPARAQEENRTVRVGYPIQRGLTQKDENGVRSGYSYDYLMEIAKYTNWQYEFVEVDGTVDEQLSALLVMLENGEIDLLGGMLYSDALSRLYDYPGSSYGTSYYTLCALESNTEITGANYYLLPSLRVAVYSTQKVKNEKLEQFAQMSGITAEQVFCSSEEEMVKRLRQGDVDVILAKDTALPAENLKIIAQFSPQPCYFATTKGNREIVNGLDGAFSLISKNNPYFATNLWNKYFALPGTGVYFSGEEKKYLEEVGPLKAVIMGGRPPIQYIDRTTGQYRGVSMNVLDYIAQETGLTFDTVMTDSFEEYARLMQSGEAALAVGVTDSLFQYDWQECRMTMPFLVAPISIVLTDGLNPGDIDGKRLAMQEGTRYNGKYRGKVAYYETGEECLNAVHEGKADYCYANTWSVQYYISNPDCRNLIAVPQDEEWATQFCIGVIDPSDELLPGILNKVLQDFSEKNLLAGYLYENAYRQETVTLGTYLKANPMEAFLLCTLFLLAVIMAGMILSRRMDRKNQQIRRMENGRYEQLSEISNELLFEYDVRKDQVKLTEKCAEYLNMPRLIENASCTGISAGTFIERLINGVELNGEIQVPVADGRMHWMRITTKGVEDAEGNPIYLVGKLADIQEEREEKEKLQVRAERDGLTGVYNMATFREKLLSMYQELDAGQYVFYIIDIDYFKRVNDTYGHYIGDFVLERIGRILLEVFSGETDETGRLGGDEFVAQTAYGGDPEEVCDKCRMLNQAVSQIEFEGMDAPVTVSIGAVVVAAGKDFEEVYRLADEALYEVKRESRNSFRIYGHGETDG